jgi:hypothetical protein
MDGGGTTFFKVISKTSNRREPDDTLGPEGTLCAVIQYRRLGFGPKGHLSYELRNDGNTKQRPQLLVSYHAKHIGRDKFQIHCEGFSVQKIVMKEPKFTHVKMIIKSTTESASDFSGTVDSLKVPLLVLINPNSGGKQGKSLYTSLNKLLPRHQVINILQGGALQA